MLLLLATITLGGCLPDQAKNLAACQAESDRFYRTYQGGDMDNPRSQFIIACMAAKGYEFTIVPKDCDSHHSLPNQPACYILSGWPAWAIDRFSRFIKDN